MGSSGTSNAIMLSGDTHSPCHKMMIIWSTIGSMPGHYNTMHISLLSKLFWSGGSQTGVLVPPKREKVVFDGFPNFQSPIFGAKYFPCVRFDDKLPFSKKKVDPQHRIMMLSGISPLFFQRGNLSGKNRIIYISCFPSRFHLLKKSERINLQKKWITHADDMCISWFIRLDILNNNKRIGIYPRNVFLLWKNYSTIFCDLGLMSFRLFWLNWSLWPLPPLQI